MGHGITTNQAISGTKLLFSLEKMGIHEGDLTTFVEQVYMATQKSGSDPKQVVTYSIKLYDIESETGKSYGEIVEDAVELLSKISKQKSELAQQEKQIAIIDGEIKGLIEERGTTAQELGHFTAVREDLEKYGFNLADLVRLRNLIGNCAKLNFDPKKVVDLVSGVEDLEGTRRDLEDKNEGLRTENENLEIMTTAQKRELDALAYLKKKGLSNRDHRDP